MLPESKNLPTAIPKFSSYLNIPLLVTRKLSTPVFLVFLRDSSALGARVPEAPVDKHGYSFAAKDKVGVPRQLLMASPSRNVRDTQ